MSPTSRSKIRKSIEDIIEEAGGPDGINNKILKCVSVFIDFPLERLFNLCIEKKQFWQIFFQNIKLDLIMLIIIVISQLPQP